MPLHPRDIELIRTIIREEIAAGHGRRDSTPAPTPDPRPAIAEKFCGTRAELAAATGLSRWALKAIASLSKGEQGCPFRGRGAYPSAIQAWVEAHPDFSAALAFPRAR